VAIAGVARCPATKKIADRASYREIGGSCREQIDIVEILNLLL
jgi:hypothetical protein